MKRVLLLLLTLFCACTYAAQPPQGLVSRSGDLSIVLHWDPNMEQGVAGYRVYRAPISSAPFVLQNTTTLTAPGFCDFNVTNRYTNFYQVRTITGSGQESEPSATIAAASRPFANNDEFLEYVQQTCFDYFWYGANPTNGLVPDRSSPSSPCSIAAVGFGLTAIGIGIDHGWITRTQGAARVRTTLNTFLQGPQGPASSGTIGHNGWFYHFLDMRTGLRYLPFNTELSSIDTALLLAGVIYASEFFDGSGAQEAEIRSMANALVDRVNWNWMAQGTNVLSMGWLPTSGFLTPKWTGYNEAMILYLMGMGASTNALPASSWTRWTSGYTWATYYGQSFVPFPPLFGHQYSHCWVDFRHVADAYMRSRNSTYFENSRRASLAQRSYCVAANYPPDVWGITACDGPNGYSARGAPPSQNDDGTIAPTAAGGSIAFTPQESIAALRYFYNVYRRNIWTSYGFRDAFNLGANWWGPDTLGIDQGPIVIMIENHRTQKVWKTFMRNALIQRGLERAGFVALPFSRPTLHPIPQEDAFNLRWDALPGRTYKVEYSPDLFAWFGTPTGYITASNAAAGWTDNGPPGTPIAPLDVSQRFYRVFRFGEP